MAKPREPNAQNSELDPQTHPSGDRIEKMNSEVDRAKGELGHGLEKKYDGTHDVAEGSREETPRAPHRTTPETRTR